MIWFWIGVIVFVVVVAPAGVELIKALKRARQYRLKNKAEKEKNALVGNIIRLEHECFPEKSVKWFNHPDTCLSCHLLKPLDFPATGPKPLEVEPPEFDYATRRPRGLPDPQGLKFRHAEFDNPGIILRYEKPLTGKQAEDLRVRFLTAMESKDLTILPSNVDVEFLSPKKSYDEHVYEFGSCDCVYCGECRFMRRGRH